MTIKSVAFTAAVGAGLLGFAGKADAQSYSGGFYYTPAPPIASTGPAIMYSANYRAPGSGTAASAGFSNPYSGGANYNPYNAGNNFVSPYSGTYPSNGNGYNNNNNWNGFSNNGNRFTNGFNNNGFGNTSNGNRGVNSGFVNANNARNEMNNSFYNNSGWNLPAVGNRVGNYNRRIGR